MPNKVVIDLANRLESSTDLDYAGSTKSLTKCPTIETSESNDYEEQNYDRFGTYNTPNYFNNDLYGSVSTDVNLTFSSKWVSTSSSNEKVALSSDSRFSLTQFF
jgi:hypothetical protein